MPRNTFFIQKFCDRCGRSLADGRTMSFFTNATLCIACSDKESEIRSKIREQEGDPNADLKYEGCGVVPQTNQGVSNG